MSTDLIRIPSLDGRAACAGTDPAMFFPEPGGNVDAARAKAICNNNCPVRAACLQWATVNNEAGIWGGTTEDERKGRAPAENKPQLLTPINHGTEAGFVLHNRRGEEPCPDCHEGARRAWRLRRDRKRAARLARQAG